MTEPMNDWCPENDGAHRAELAEKARHDPRDRWLDEAGILLRDFRDYAAKFAPAGAHTNPIWGRVASFIEVHGPSDPHD